jgi:hypothetical protein
VAAFAAAAALSVAEDIVRAERPALGEGADPAVVAEETLALVATVTGRATEAALGEAPGLAGAVGAALAELPFLYHDYLLGTVIVAQGGEGAVPVDQSVYTRLARKADFYAAHVPPGRAAGAPALAAVLPLWMGRVSPPKLPSTPQERLEPLGIADMLGVHSRLVQAFARRAATGEP